MFSPQKNPVYFVNLIFDYVLVKFYFTTCWHAAIVLRIQLVCPMLHLNVSSIAVCLLFFSVFSFFPLLFFLIYFLFILLHTHNPNIQGFQLSKEYIFSVCANYKTKYIISWMKYAVLRSLVHYINI
jgi:hypothetical protein